MNNTSTSIYFKFSLGLLCAFVFLLDPALKAGTAIKFEVHSSTASVSSFSPAGGSIGTLVTINGSGFSNLSSVTIGGVQAIAVSNTGTSIVAMVMPGAVTGSVSVTDGGSATTAPGNFTVKVTPYPIQQQGSKIAGTPSSSAQEGNSVAVSADGNTVITGAAYDNDKIGAAFIYTRKAGIWSQQAKLLGTGATGNAMQGSGVSISADGNTVIIGGITDNGSVGASWIFTRTGSTWIQQGNKLVGDKAKGTAQQGYAVSMSADGNTVLIGGPGDDGFIGAAWIFNRNAGSWSQKGPKLVATGWYGGYTQIGASVSLSADGTTALLGGYNDKGSSNGKIPIGASWVFALSSGNWVQQAKLVGTGWVGTNAIYQGMFLALNADGNTAVISGRNDNNGAGAVWVFTRTGSTWSQQGAKLVVPYSLDLGQSVSVSADGNTLFSGGIPQQSTSAWVFTRTGQNWTQQGGTLTGSGNVGGYGSNVALSSDGSTGILGSYRDNNSNGASWIFTPGSPTITASGTLQSMKGTYGSGSASQSFSISGSFMAAGILATAPSGFELSADNLTFGKTLTVGAAGTINQTKVFIRLSAGAHAGNYSGNVVLASAGAPSLNEATAPGNQLPASLTVKANGQTCTYGAPIPVLSFSYQGFVNQDTPDNFTVKPVATTNAVQGSPAGTYAINAGKSPIDADYTYTNQNGSLVINQAPLTVKADDQVKLYGQAIPALTISYLGFVNGEDSSSLTTRSASSTLANLKSAVGTYPVMLSSASAKNYLISYSPGKLKINQAPLILKADPEQKVYGQPDPAFTITYSGFVNGDDSSSLKPKAMISTKAAKGPVASAGSYTETVTGAADSNYSITYIPGTFTVLQARLKITATDTVKNYGSSLSDMASSAAFISAGLQNLETISSVKITYAQGRAAADAVGIYSGSVQPSAASGGSASLSNYSLTYVNGNIQVIAIDPGVITLATTIIKSSTARLNASVTDGGAQTTVMLQYSTDPMLKAAKNAVFSIGSNQVSPGAGYTGISSKLAGLIQGTLYYFRFSASNSAGTTTDTIGSFTTLSTNASLASASLSSGPLAPSFSSGTYSYSSVSTTSNSSTTLSWLTGNKYANVQVNGVSMGLASSTDVPLNFGNNPIKIVVTAQDSITQLVYTINVYRVFSSLPSLADNLGLPGSNGKLTLLPLSAGNILSPNNDGINDVWIVKDILNYPENMVTVYNRTGRVVYMKKGYTNDWGGTSHGTLLKGDTYYYRVDYGPGERKIKGFITLVRDL